MHTASFSSLNSVVSDEAEESKVFWRSWELQLHFTEASKHLAKRIWNRKYLEIESKPIIIMSTFLKII